VADDETSGQVTVQPATHDVETLLDQARVPGVAMALVRGERLEFSGGFGVLDRDGRQPASATTIFSAMSLSKPVFAYGVMLLRQLGRIDLDVPLERYLPAPYVEDEPRLSLISARTVLSHQTGFPNWRPRGEQLRLLRTPGEQFGYSGEGFLYLQRVVERIAGAPLEQFMDSAVFRPLGMDDSSFIWRDDYGERAAIPHDESGTAIRRRDFTRANAASSLHTTARDYASFMIALSGHADGGTRAPLAREQIAEMLAPQVKIDASLSWALGFGVEHASEGDAVWHWGSDDGAATFFVLDRRKHVGVVVLSNGGNGRAVYKPLVYGAIPGDHPSLELESSGEWLRLNAAQG
jgi:CubicO group peptidase (beta-lactamase class C family)